MTRPRCEPFLAREGFTLVEVLTALFIVALVCAGMTAGTRLAIRASSKSEAAYNEVWQIYYAQNGLRGLLESIERPASGSGAGNEKDGSVIFEGETDRLRCIIDLPPHMGVGGRHILSLSFGEPDGRGRALLLRIGLADEKDVSRPDPTRILDDVDSVSFQYFGARGNQRPQWSASWKSAGLVPRLIRIDVVLKGRPSRTWNTLIVQPRITAGGA